MANKQTEYHRGRQQGMEMSCRLLAEAGDDYGVKVIPEELHKRGSHRQLASCSPLNDCKTATAARRCSGFAFFAAEKSIR